MAFSSTAQWLAVSSDKGTVHVFSLKVNSSVPEHEKSESPSSSDAAISPSSSSRSFIKFKGKLLTVCLKNFSEKILGLVVVMLLVLTAAYITDCIHQCG